MKNLLKRILTITASLALVVVVGVCMTACGSDAPKEESTAFRDTCVANLKAEDYTVTVRDTTMAVTEYVNNLKGGNLPQSFRDLFVVAEIEWQFDAQNSSTNQLVMIKFTTETKATAVRDGYQKLLDDPDGIAGDLFTARVGKIVVFGDLASTLIALR